MAMFFCVNCDNIYDITKMDAKEINNTIDTEIDAITDTNTETSINVDELINKLINDEPQEKKDVGFLTVTQITNNNNYKKLSVANKKKVTVNFKKIIDQTNQELAPAPIFTSAHFMCNNCGHKEPIKPGTQIIKKNYNVSSNITNKDYKDMIHVPYIPRTRDYVCPNDKCKSHKDHTQREAVFFRMDNSYKVKYVCSSCKTSW